MSMPRILAEQREKLPILIDSATCSGKTYIVTGSNTGIGLETARHLVRSSASRVILAVRNVKAGEVAKLDLERSTSRTGVVSVWTLDLASNASVKAFASKAENELDRVDAVVQNAGVWLDNWTEAEGMETSMTVNVMNTMFLGMLLMPKLTESARLYAIHPRLIFLTSGLGFQAGAYKEMKKGGNSEIFKKINNRKEQAMSQRYALTKLVEMYAVRAFAQAYPLEKTHVVINMVTPGICQTSLARDTGTMFRAVKSVLNAVVARTAEEGSRTILHALLAEEETHGKHLSGCKVKECWVPSWMNDADGQHTQQQIWKELTASMDNKEPGCVTAV